MLFTVQIVAGMLTVIGGGVIGHVQDYHFNGNYVMIEYTNPIKGDGCIVIDSRRVQVG
jgi:hypothetical protein